jgi:hypothetical protein
MAGEPEDKKNAGKTWMDILGERMDQELPPPPDEKPAAPPATKDQTRSVRFSDLAPPTNTLFAVHTEQTAPAPALETKTEDALEDIRRKLAESAKRVRQMTAALPPSPPSRPEPAAPPPSAQAQPPADDGQLAELRRKLTVSEEKCTWAESRVSELEAEVESLRVFIAESGTHETEELRIRLAEAYEIIRAIEQAYLAGECAPPEASAGRP